MVRMKRIMVEADKHIIAEACRWAVINRGGGVTDEQRAAMEAWLSESPKHLKAYTEIEAIAFSATSLKSLASLEPRPSKLHDSRLRTVRRLWTMQRVPRPRLSALVGVAASAAAALLIVPNLIRADFQAATGIAETQVLVLKDGTRLTLGPKSEIRVRFLENERYVELADGEAFFEVARDINRPFIVNAGDTRVHVLGTKFDVSHNAETVRTSVLEGTVQVQENAPIFSQSTRYLLNANQKVETQANVALLGRRPHAAVLPVSTPPGEWRKGRLAYTNARLSDVVMDLNRYYSPGIKLADGTTGEMRVTTTFMRNEIEAFFSNLPMILPLTVYRGQTGQVIISPRTNLSQKG